MTKTNSTKSYLASTAAWLTILPALFLCAFGSATAFAAVNVSPIFGSNMVLQRDVSVPVFGTADPGATVTVQFQSQSVRVRACRPWRPPTASGGSTLTA